MKAKASGYNWGIITLPGIISILIVIIVFGCGGGGGGGDDTTSITISGTVDDGTVNSPIPNASCMFLDRRHLRHGGIVYSNASGEYNITVPAGIDGQVMCSPQDLSNLAIYTFFSTIGMSSGDRITGENVNPATTIVADILSQENPSDPKARKQELLAAIENRSDEQLAMVVEMSTLLYKMMYEQRVNVNFGGDGGGDGSGGDGGGVGGDAGDGGDFSAIANARCEFIIGNNLKERKVLYSAALADLLSYGKISRPDMNKIAELVNSALSNHSPEEIIGAFSRIFPQGIGQPYVATADGNGSYFIEIPPNVSGYVRCVPPDQDNLVLATYISDRSEGEKLLGQDVNPATTIFSNNIGSKLTVDLGTTKENFLDDITGLGVHIVIDNGVVSNFQVSGMPTDENVGMVAFSATSLYNIFYKNGINGDFLSALDDLVSKKAVDPAFLQAQGLPEDQANVVVDSVGNAGNILVDLPSALSTSRIRVAVTDIPGGQSIIGATVRIVPDEIPDGVFFSPEETTSPAFFTLTGVPTGADIAVTVEVSNVPGFDPVRKTVSVVAFATVNLEVALTSSFALQVQVAGDGYGFVTSSPAGIDCGTHANETEGSACTENFSSGTLVTLSASAVWGDVFAGWSGGTCSGTGLCIVDLSQPTSVTATFMQQSLSAPIVDINSVVVASQISDSEYYTVMFSVDIFGTASDTIGVNSVTWSSSRGGSGTCEGTTSWHCANVELSGGTNVITVAARNSAGISGTDTVTVTANLESPVVNITSPTSSATYTTFNNTINISGTASDDYRLEVVEWRNVSSETTDYGTCTGTTNWSTGSIQLYSGTNEIRITAWDSGRKYYGIDTLTVTYSPNIAPDIHSPDVTLIALNDPSCSLLGSPYGSLFNVRFFYFDTNGNGPTNIYQAGLTLSFVYENGVNGGFSNYTWNSTVQGAGGNGLVDARQCYRFGSNDYVDVTMTITDQLGLRSDPLTVRISAPEGSN